MTHAQILEFLNDEMDWIQEGLSYGDNKWPYETELFEVHPVDQWSDVDLSYVPERNADGSWRAHGTDGHVAVRVDDKHLFESTADLIHDKAFLSTANPVIVAIRIRSLEDSDYRTSWVYVRRDRMPSPDDIGRLWHGREFDDPT